MSPSGKANSAQGSAAWKTSSTSSCRSSTNSTTACPEWKTSCATEWRHVGMGKKPQRHGWPEAKKLCRLNQDDIEMAKRLGFGPDSLIRARPDPKQKWKLPVKLWVRELHSDRFGYV